MKDIFLIPLCILALLWPSITRASGINENEICQKTKFPIVKGELDITDCQDLEKNISLDAIDKAVKQEEIKDATLPPISLKSCAQLQEMHADSLSSLYDNGYNNFKADFGKDFRHWTKADYDLFINAIVGCRSNGFFKNYNPQFIKMTVSRQLKRLETSQEQEQISYAIDEIAGKILEERKLAASVQEKELKTNIAHKYSKSGPEDGWKNLKWGMTFEEVTAVWSPKNIGWDQCKKFDLNVTHGSNSCGLQIGPNKHMDLPQDPFQRRLQEMECEGAPTGVLFFDGEFFGVKIDVAEDYISKADKQAIDIVLRELKEKYPKGKIVYLTGTLLPQIQYPHGLKYKYPNFEYESNHIKVFTDEGALYFYNPEVLKEMANIIKKKSQDEKTSEQNRLKNLF